jgi:hypothetical protein
MPGKTYLPGDLAKKAAADQVYEAVVRHVGRTEKELDDANLCLPREMERCSMLLRMTSLITAVAATLSMLLQRFLMHRSASLLLITT